MRPRGVQVVPSVVILVALALATGCKERGTHTVTISGLDDCAADTTDVRVQVALVREGRCGVAPATCSCAACEQQCTGDCTLACGAEGCTIEELQDAIHLDPGEPGDYAIVILFLSFEDPAQPRFVGTACADVELDEDGTSSETVTAPVTCCGGS
jgi:hypothetical protein